MSTKELIRREVTDKVMSISCLYISPACTDLHMLWLQVSPSTVMLWKKTGQIINTRSWKTEDVWTKAMAWNKTAPYLCIWQKVLRIFLLIYYTTIKLNIHVMLHLHNIWSLKVSLVSTDCKNILSNCMVLYIAMRSYTWCS